MFELIISVISLIISILVVTILFNISNKLVISTTGKKISELGVVQYIYIGMIMVLLCFLTVDLATSLLQTFF